MSIFLGGSDMSRTPFIRVLVLFLVAFHMVPIGQLRAQVPGTAGHEHLTEVACVDVPPREKRPEFGCFNIGVVTGLHFSQASVYWLSPPSDHCSFPQQRATLRFSLTPSCGRATVRGCIHTRDPKAGTCWPESSVWRLRLAQTGLGPEEP
jgi:hypothetical protein